MNGTEREYSRTLEDRRTAGEVLWWAFGAWTFKLADDTRYTPDFAVMLADNSLECHEVKGFWRDDARVKVRVAAAMFPVRFLAVTKRRKRDGGGWDVERF